MKTFKVLVPENVTNYINLLDFNVNARKDLVFESTQRFGKDNDITKKYEQEFFIYSTKFELAKNNLANTYIPEEIKNATNWSLEYATSILTIEVNDNDKVIRDFINNYNPENKELNESIVIDKEIKEKLDDIYNADFDDELGLKE